MKTLWFSLKIMAVLATVFLSGYPVAAQTVLSKLLPDITAAELVEGADAFGTTHPDIPVVQVLKGETRIGWAYVTSDFVSTTGYSGKPIHTMVAIDDAAQVIGVQLVKHSEPIVLIGIPDKKVKALVANYRGLDLVAEFFFDRQTALIVLIRPAAVAHRANKDKADLGLVLGHCARGQAQCHGCACQKCSEFHVVTPQVGLVGPV